MTIYNYKGVKIHANSKKEAIKQIVSERIISNTQVISDSRDTKRRLQELRHKKYPVEWAIYVNHACVSLRPSKEEAIKEAKNYKKQYPNYEVQIMDTNFRNGQIIKANAEEVTAKWDNQPLMQQAMQEACRIAEVDDVGKLSDGYHTFDDLYWQRCILFAKLVELFKDKAWKTKRHEDGELCFGGDNFLVCIDTPNGPYSYHYPMKDWDLFKCKELYKAKPFDGHTSKDVERILSL